MNEWTFIFISQIKEKYTYKKTKMNIKNQF